MALFEGYDRRIPQINELLKKHGLENIEAADALCKSKGVDVYALSRAYSQSASRTPAGPIPWVPPLPSRRVRRRPLTSRYPSVRDCRPSVFPVPSLMTARWESATETSPACC